MEYPELIPIPTERVTVDAFRGYNRNLRIGAGEWRHMENMTSDHYPVLSPREPRQVWRRPASPQGILAKEKLCYVDGGDFLIGDDRYPLSLSTAAADCPKQLISMGAYVIILPDKCYINTLNPADRGSLDAAVTLQAVTLRLCREDGGELAPKHAGKTPPQNPENGDYWLDTSEKPAQLKQWSETMGGWSTLTTTYLRLEAPGIGVPFAPWDGVTISGFPESHSLLNTASVIRSLGPDHIVVAGLPQQAVESLDCPITVERRSPPMDFAVECGNRLWACRFGDDGTGETVNRLYASKLGDFKNWNCYMGLSTDSYYVNLGTDGPFTGAAAHLGSVLFFKENGLHKVYGSAPSDFTVQDTPCRGVQPGCHLSLAIVGEMLYYRSRTGVCAYDGSLPVEVSYALGQMPCSYAAAGAQGSKYYLSLVTPEGTHLMVYDTKRSFWHREDDFLATGFASLEGRLYAIDGRNYNILILDGAPEPDEGQVQWLAQTGELGLGNFWRKYISRVLLRLFLPVGSYMDVYAQYDQSREWVHLCHVRGTDLNSICVPVRPRRCDFLRLRFQGRGQMKLYGMVQIVEKGSE